MVLIVFFCHFSRRYIRIFPTANMFIRKYCATGITFSVDVVTGYVWKTPENGFPSVSNICLKELNNIETNGSANAVGWRRER